MVLDHIGRGETGRAKHEENVVERLMERVCHKAGLPQGEMAPATAQLRNPRRYVWREPVAAHDVDGPQARGRDDVVRAIPASVLNAGAREEDPDTRILAMLR